MACFTFTGEQRQTMSDASSSAKKEKTGGLIAAIVVSILVTAGICFMVLRSGTSASANSESHPATKVKAVLHLETFTVNVGDSSQSTYLRIGIDLGLDRDPKQGG